jgi:hypothetical protein
MPSSRAYNLSNDSSFTATLEAIDEMSKGLVEQEVTEATESKISCFLCFHRLLRFLTLLKGLTNNFHGLKLNDGASKLILPGSHLE